MFLNQLLSATTPNKNIFKEHPIKKGKMELASMIPSSNFSIGNPRIPNRTQIASSVIIPTAPHSLLNSSMQKSTTLTKISTEDSTEASMPTMSEILDSSRSQNLDIKLQTLGPFFRITAKSLDTQKELGRAEGLVRFWLKGKILHLDSIRLRRETLGMEKSIFGIGLFIGAVAIRHGYDCGCKIAELLAINDSEIYHRKLVRFYSRIGFTAVHEVTGSTFGDLADQLVWGGIGTRMDANVEALMIKWCTRFKSKE